MSGLGLPRISIITPSLNQAGFIEQTIRSVLDQDYPDLEYIVVDGGSTDGTIGILKKYTHGLRWISEPDRGQSHAINKGLRMSTGEVLGFLNSDDVYAPGALRAVGDWFSGHPCAAWATGRCRIIDQDGREIRKAISFYKNLWLRLNNPVALQVLNYISQPATFWRRQVLDEAGFLDEGLHYAMEYDYWLRISRSFPLKLISRELACYRVHPRSKAGSSARAQFDAEWEIARRHVRSVFLLALHRLHLALVIGVYERLPAEERIGPRSNSRPMGE